MPLPGTPRIRRRLLIIAAVLGFHAAGIWALQSGLVRRAVEQFVPVHVLAELIESPQPEVAQAPPVRTRPEPRPAVQPAAPKPRPVIKTDATPVLTVTAPAASQSPQPPSPVPATALSPSSEPSPHVTSTAVPTSPPAPARVELPSSNAEYLNNPRPTYPPLSKRLGEQGKVVLSVFIEANGSATRAEIRSSSGFDRLDETALQTVLRWRYVPGKRNGVPEAMWFNVPISFVLE